MRVARINGRLSLLAGDGAVDVNTASDGRFPADPDAVFDQWDELRDWAAGRGSEGAEPYSRDQLGAPVLNPKQVFAIGLNYRDHAAESGVAVPSAPAVFTKFATCLTGPYDTVRLPSDKVDWEVELVVAIGRRAWQVSEEDAWSHVAGLSVGQDLSERAVQLVGPVPQFSLGKSYPGFGPVGPAIVTPDELSDPDDLSLICAVDEELLQKGRTSDMVFSVSELIARLSAVCPLLPGDLIFTGTPPGVGMARTPARYLTGDTTLVSAIDGIGELRNPLVTD
jgi:2-keto-4-pentenoate hydratase/2-oxohepta-3-ene-1,7-dioic acid hydratase in catechol pathway